MKTKLIILFWLSALIIGCRDNDSEKQLAVREQTLLEKEKQFALKEADYQSLRQMRDSLFAAKDSVMVLAWPIGVAGRWTSKVICNESNCDNYVIGDQRTDTWDFSSDSTGLFTRVISNNKLTRIFSGNLDKGKINLYYASDSTAMKKVKMNVTLAQIDSNLIKGTQIVNGENNCIARFSVELTRIKNK